MPDGAAFARHRGETEWANIAAAVVGPKGGAVGEGVAQGHDAAGLAQGEIVGVELFAFTAPIDEGEGREAAGGVEVLIDVEGVESGVGSP